MKYYMVENTKDILDFSLLAYEDEEAEMLVEKFRKTISKNNYPLKIVEISEERYYFSIDRMYRPMV